MRWLAALLLANDLVPTLAFIWLYQRYQPGPYGWRRTEFGRQMMSLAGVMAVLLSLSLVATLAPMAGMTRVGLLAMATVGHLSLAAALWWRVRLLVRAQRQDA